jgi:hypothetical protein
MSDLDSELRRLASAIATDAPAAPDYGDLGVLVGDAASRSPRRHWRALAVAVVVVGLLIAAAAIIANVGGSTQQQPLGPSPARRGSAAPGPDTVADCVARQTGAVEFQGEPSPPPGMMAMYDRGTKQTALISIRDYCEAVIRLTPPKTGPNDLSTVQFYLENGVVKAVPGPPLSVTPIGPTTPVSTPASVP